MTDIEDLLIFCIRSKLSHEVSYVCKTANNLHLNMLKCISDNTITFWLDAYGTDSRHIQIAVMFVGRVGYTWH